VQYSVRLAGVLARISCGTGRCAKIKLELLYVHERDFVQDVIRALRLVMMFTKNWWKALIIIVKAFGVGATEG